MTRVATRRVQIDCVNDNSAKALLFELAFRGWHDRHLPGVRLGRTVVVEFPYEPGGPEISRLNFRPEVESAALTDDNTLTLLSPSEIIEQAGRDMLPVDARIASSA